MFRSNRKTSVGDFDKLTKKLKKWFEAAQHLGRLAKPHVATIEATAKR